ncbi:hypothetical protein [Sphingomonas cavernae]|uniref:Uncharacterized protein n=1 Tax=Sphingomonas cavernae TaxID=2320861 RepID=A0A418WL12_9SPHN|nr:hypothetical protein [Sphingomonas cavernae]RJF90726.1 hypothetical protein D3876_11000 [Sphingomonas cavernae]
MMKVYNTTRLAFQTAPVSLSRWKSVSATFEQAIAELHGFEHEFLEPARRAFTAVRDKWPGDSEMRKGSLAQMQIEKARAIFEPVKLRHDQLVGVVNDAVDDMLATPAPSIAAMTTKLRIAVEGECKGRRSADENLRLLLSDAQRLSGEATG